VAAKLRPGNVHSAEGWEELLLPEIVRQQRRGKEVVFRSDAAFAKPEVYDALELRGVKCAIGIPANEKLERDVAELLACQVVRPSHKPGVWCKSFFSRTPPVGRQQGERWRRLSIMPGSCSRASGSS